MSLSARAQFALYCCIALSDGRYRFWRLALECRDDGEIRVLWSDGREPESFSVLFRFWACQHPRVLTVHRDDGTCAEQCIDCPTLLNYRLNREEAWLSKRYWENRSREPIS